MTDFHSASSDGREAERPRVAIVGAGFAGIEAAQALRGAPVEVMLIDRNNYHKFQPLLYQIATAGLTSGNVTMPVRDLLRGQDNATFRRATIADIDPAAQRIRAEAGASLTYDVLVLGVGAVTNYVDIEGVTEHAFPLKDIPDALNLRNHVLECFETCDCNAALRDSCALDAVIVGGGPTGVETAAMMSELFSQTMCRDFDWVEPDTATVHLVDRGDALMKAYPPPLREYTRRSLEQRGVEVHLNTAVEAVTEEGARTSAGFLQAGTVVWAAGVRAHPLAETMAEALDVDLDRGGRLPVTRALHVPEHPSIYAAGDVAGARNEDGELYPQLAPVAIQQGKHVARQIRRQLQGREPEPFHYRDLGKMATIGRNAGIADLAGGIQFTGVLAWLIWAIVHVTKLPGLRNRLIAFMNWVYNYLTDDRKARMIVDTIPLHRAAEPSVRRIRRKLQSLENGEPSASAPEEARDRSASG
jgi:NADH dehydrogenase